MNKMEKATLRKIVQHLRGERTTEAVREALTKPAGLYLESWIIPALELLAKDERTRRDLENAFDLVS